MTKEEQFCNVTQAKRLKQLGVKQESLFYHSIGWVQGYNPDRYLLATQHEAAEGETERYSAFSVAELGVMLQSEDDKYFVISEWIRHDDCYKATLYERNENKKEGEPAYIATHEKEGDTEAQARAAMLIYMRNKK